MNAELTPIGVAFLLTLKLSGWGVLALLLYGMVREKPKRRRYRRWETRQGFRNWSGGRY